MTTVYVVSLGRKYLYFQWVDPDTGKRVSRSSKCTTRREAERKAAILENQLSSERLGDGSIAFTQFISRYTVSHLAALTDGAESKASGVLGSYERLMAPRTLADVRTSTLTDYCHRLRELARSEATIASHLGAMRAALRWAKDQGLIQAVPTIPKITRSLSGRKMKGRPLTDAEFRKMLRAVRGIVGRPAARSWRHLLTGLWLSGLRLKESLALTWDADGGMRIDWTGPLPMLAIQAESEKGFRDRRLPITPDFAGLLERTPPADRSGFVFRPLGERGDRVYSHFHVSRVISQIGEAAGIVVDPRKKKYASAHDLRRSFGTRWARKGVEPQILMELMRHESIDTTMDFYVELRGEETAADLWRRFGRPDGPTQHRTQQ